MLQDALLEVSVTLDSRQVWKSSNGIFHNQYLHMVQLHPNGWQTGNKATKQAITEYVVRCRSMSYDVLCALETSCSLKIILLCPYCTSQLTKCNSADVVSLLLLLSRRCKAMRTPLSPRSLPTQCRKKGFNATHSLCSTTVFTLGHPVCFKLPLFQWFAHFANLRIPLFERVSAGLRLPCASGCRRLRAEDLQKSANCLG
jgi:hypothetical protein